MTPTDLLSTSAREHYGLQHPWLRRAVGDATSLIAEWGLTDLRSPTGLAGESLVCIAERVGTPVVLKVAPPTVLRRQRSLTEWATPVACFPPILEIDARGILMRRIEGVVLDWTTASAWQKLHALHLALRSQPRPPMEGVTPAQPKEEDALREVETVAPVLVRRYHEAGRLLRAPQEGGRERTTKDIVVLADLQRDHLRQTDTGLCCYDPMITYATDGWAYEPLLRDVSDETLDAIMTAASRVINPGIFCSAALRRSIYYLGCRLRDDSPEHTSVSRWYDRIASLERLQHRLPKAL